VLLHQTGPLQILSRQSSSLKNKFKSIKTKTKTANEMNLQDLTDDLCSSGLADAGRTRQQSGFVSGTIVVGTANYRQHTRNAIKQCHNNG